MSFRAKRELLLQVSARYQAASHQQKSIILDEFIAATGDARKYAIRLLTQPAPAPVTAITRPRTRRYGPAVQEALRVAWAAANGICGKRLVPFLPELVASLERHGHLQLTAEVRAQLLTLSPATADRLLHRCRFSVILMRRRTQLWRLSHRFAPQRGTGQRVRTRSGEAREFLFVALLLVHRCDDVTMSLRTDSVTRCDDLGVAVVFRW